MTSEGVSLRVVKKVKYFDEELLGLANALNEDTYHVHVFLDNHSAVWASYESLSGMVTGFKL